VEKENQSITKLLLVQETMREPFLFHLPWRKEDLNDLVEKEGDVREREEERRERNVFPT
jgi:hypothetical protein